MSRYDGLIIPRSYSEYINKTDAATLSQALQLGGVLDSAPTEDSVKAVKSGGVYTALAGKQPTLTFDNVPTEDSDNPVKSGGIYDALATKQDTLTFDDTPTQNSNNPVKSGGIYDALATKQDTLTFDDTPTQNSNNPVKSGGVYTALSKKQDNVFIVKETKSIASTNWTAVCQIANVPAGNYKVELSMDRKCQTNIQNTTTGEGLIPFLNNDTANRVAYLTIPQTSNIQIAAQLAANTSYTFVLQLTKNM